MKKQTLKKIITKKDNILSLVTICIAIIVVIADLFGGGIYPQITSNIIIILLTLIAITNFIERESRFTSLDNTISNFHKLLGKTNSQAFVHNNEIPNFKDLSKGASEFFVAGAQYFNLILRNIEFWEQWLKDGKTLKIIVQNPLNQGLKHLKIPICKYSYKTYHKSMTNVLDRLKSIGQARSSNLQIKVSNSCPTQGVVIVDGHLGGTTIVVAFYLPDCDSNSRPIVVLEKDIHNEWFNLFYLKYYEHLWDNSELI